MKKLPIKINNPEEFNPETMQIIFVHIPKSGGTSLHAVISEIVKDRYFHLIPGENQLEDISKLSVIGGHFNFEADFLQESNKDRVYITLLRDPVERFISFYHHVQARPYHHLSKAYPDLTKMGPGEFARKLASVGDSEISNLQCHMITNKHGTSGLDAVQHAHKFFTICAPLTNQTEVISWLSKAFNLEYMPKMLRLNTSASEERVILDDVDRAYIEELNSNDISLYEKICKDLG